ncbi:MAG: Hsp20/alpha crystallin family protein [Desulfuromonadales bacterium]|nr:Hsp20/alpha crystallin family protein [Desulfuromonadales bacterium]
MTLRDLIPWKRNKDISIERGLGNPLQQLQWGIDRLFDDFMENLDWPSTTEDKVLSPRIDVAETDKEVTVTAEMPGLDEKDIDVSLERDSLVIRGNKESKKEDKGKSYFRTERAYSSFYRTIPLPCEIDDNQIKATYEKGLLTVHLPKAPDAAGFRKQIEIH